MNKKNYGLPYKGSKSDIAEDIVNAIPPGGKILDACCGGAAFLQCAAQSLRFNSVVGNDINPAVVKLVDAVFIHKGQIEYEHPLACSRNDFFLSLQKIENGNFEIQDCVNKFCASFGNEGKSYLYGKDVEDYKLIAEKMLTSPTLEQRRSFYRKFVEICQTKERVNELERLERLERLKRLERLGLERLERLERLDNKSLFDIDYSEFDVVYFDIPYRGTSQYDFQFDYERFYNLFESLPIPAFLSEYNAPFVCVAEFDKCQKMAPSIGMSRKQNGLEKLYFNGTKEKYIELMGRNYTPPAEQMALF